MRFQGFQSQILAMILNILHIKFQNHILKTQLNINWGKTRFWPTTFSSGAVFFLFGHLILVPFLGFFCVPTFN